MRVIAGKYRHRLLEWPEDVAHIRPTKDRIRESIFAALGDIEGFTCLDLYAGSGAMGIEALSRGAGFSVFVDINSIALSTIQKNLENLQISQQNAIVLSLDDISAIDRLSRDKYVFDLVILDPPYKEGKYEEIISLLKEKNLINKQSIIVVESDREIKFVEEQYEKIKYYKYGDIRVAILWRPL